jgi:hypothetical protein
MPETGVFRKGWSFRRERRITRSLTSGGDESPETTMSTSTLPRTAPAVKFEFLNWVATDAMPRDQAQSHRLHEPEYRISTIDPMTGDDIEDVTSHPSLADGNLTIYFESEATRKAYLAPPIDHPARCLPYPVSDDDDRGG